MTDPEYIDPKHLRPRPTRRESLRPQLLELIRYIYELLGPHLDTTLEEFESGFTLDMHPESEVAAWSTIAAAWLAYHQKHLDDRMQPHDVEKKLIRALLLISAGVEDAEPLDVPADIGQKLRECYAEKGLVPYIPADRVEGSDDQDKP